MQEGYLGYNYKNKRYGFLVRDLWENDGFHCGDTFEVKINGEWVKTRIEMTTDGEWYLINTNLEGDDLEHREIRL